MPVPEGPTGRGNPSGGGGRTWRTQVHDILESGNPSRLTNLINYALIGLILLNAVIFALETVPALVAEYGQAFAVFDGFSVAIFTIEYVLRLWSCVDNPVLSQYSAARVRLRFATRPLMLVDLAAILPFYLSALVSIDLRALRVLRLFRFLKLARYSPAMQALGRTLANERRALLGALLLMMALLLFASTGMYLFERHVQPDKFGSIPEAAWWALATLTTIGYGDAVPVTAFGKLFGGLVMLCGLGMFALPIAIIASGFSEEAHRRDFVVTWGMVANVPVFAQLDAKLVAEVMSLLYSRNFSEGAHVLREGETADAMYFIASGAVIVQTDSGPVRLEEGDFFGEMALIYNRSRVHTVTAATACRLLVLDKVDFERLSHQQPELRDRIKGVAEARLKAGRKKTPKA